MMELDTTSAVDAFAGACSCTNEPPTRLPRVLMFLSSFHTQSSRVPTHSRAFHMTSVPTLDVVVSTCMYGAPAPRRYVLVMVNSVPAKGKVRRVVTLP